VISGDKAHRSIDQAYDHLHFVMAAGQGTTNGALDVGFGESGRAAAHGLMKLLEVDIIDGAASFSPFAVPGFGFSKYFLCSSPAKYCLQTPVRHFGNLRAQS
jgi:hypothetical protein